MKKIWHRIPGKTDREKVPIQKESLEKGDLPALLLASALTLFLPALLLLLLLTGLAFLLFT